MAAGGGPDLAVATCARWAGERSGPLPAVTWHEPAAVAADRPGSEACVQALCGLMAVHGRDGQRPRRLGIEVASVAAGLLAAQGRLAAQVAADRSGRPAAPVRTSVLQAGLTLLSHYFVVATGLGDALRGPPLPAPGPPFRSADGCWFEIETLDGDRWKAFWARLGAADADLGRAWTVFRWRYERATCSLPRELHEAAARHDLAGVRTVALATGMSLAALRGYGDVLAEGGGESGPVARPVGPLARRPIPAAVPASSSASASASAGSLPLAGFRVVEATSRIQGPFAGMLLRMLGADVVRVQPPEGDYGRAAHTLHRGKRSVVLDLAGPPGRADLLDLVAGADVFLHNWRPGKAEDWGLDVEAVSRAAPSLVYAESSGWGDRPEGTDLLGTDFLVQASTALGHGLNPVDEPPFPSRVILADLFGALVGATAVVAALRRREREGGSWHVRPSLWAGAMALQAHVLDGLAAGKDRGRRHGRPLWSTLDRPLATQSGTLVVSVDDDDTFVRLCAACGVDPARGPRPAVEEAVAAALAAGTAAEAEERLLAAGVPAAVAAEDLATVPADPRFLALFEPVDGGGVAPRPPWTFT